MKIVDTRGLVCPAPLIKTRQGLMEAGAEETVRIIIDNQTSLNNVKRYLADNNLAFTVTEEGGVSIIVVARGESDDIKANETEYCSVATSPLTGNRNTVIAITSDRMGNGDDVLGGKLMVTFFKMLSLTEPHPTSMVFYNSGVKLAIDDSPVLDYIRELSDKGTGIYLCTTCINHFSLKDRLPVGSFSDMYQILNILNDADHIIRP